MLARVNFLLVCALIGLFYIHSATQIRHPVRLALTTDRPPSEIAGCIDRIGWWSTRDDTLPRPMRPSPMRYYRSGSRALGFTKSSTDGSTRVSLDVAFTGNRLTVRSQHDLPATTLCRVRACAQHSPAGQSADARCALRSAVAYR